MSNSTMSKAVLFVGVTLGVMTLFAPVAKGGPNVDSEGEPSASVTSVSKDRGCKDRCFHTEATCHRKRRDCQAARQSCVKGCR